MSNIGLYECLHIGMENWGLVTYRDISLLLDQNYSSLIAKHYTTTIVSHELAHQWVIYPNPKSFFVINQFAVILYKTLKKISLEIWLALFGGMIYGKILYSIEFLYSITY